MARTKISEFSATAADNTDIDNIDIAEGCAPSGINNAIRELMAQLKDMQTGASGDTFTLTTVNSTTVDTTNLEVTNLKAKDGTAAGSIADSTGVVTLTSLTGTTADYTNLEVTNIKAKDGTAAASIADSTGVMTVNTLNTGGGVISPQTGFKNRIINGGMTIDQRNAGASVTQTTLRPYVTDRFYITGSVTSKFTAQQSSTAPAGFVKSLLCTSSSAYSVGAAEAFVTAQIIEGNNVSDLGWGTANAATVTLSFWVRSSLTGTFGGAIINLAGDRSYPFTYTISSANTYEYKTITIPGDTTGTWATDNSGFGAVQFGLGAGATLSGTAGVWAAALYRSATGATSVVGTSGATFYITGVQLEKGSTATPFEFRSIGTELALCQRYLPAFNSTSTASAIPGSGIGSATTFTTYNIPFMVQARVAPTGVSISSGAHFSLDDSVTVFACDALSFNFSSNTAAQVLPTRSAAGLTQYRPYNLRFNNSSGQLLFTGCEL